MLRASVVVCTYNRAAVVERALASLAAVVAPPGCSWELIVIDNNSDDDTPDVLQRIERTFPVPMRTVRETRQGKSFALNTGIALACGELLLFTDDDVEFDPQWLANLVRPFDAPEVMGVGGRIVARWTTAPPRWWVPTGRYGLPAAIVEFDRGREPADLDEAPFGANMAYRRGVFERLGGFREDIGPTGSQLLRGEDCEIAARVFKSGGRIVYAPDAIVHHPVDLQRATKTYFRRWCYAGARSMARWGELPPDTKFWLGVPRWVFRDLVEGGVRALASGWSRRGFYWELRAWSALGVIAECWSRREAMRTGGSAC
jgi:glycosyltransferase involved in cell wall biosynthesis